MYLREIVPPRCHSCGRPAKVTLVNERNAPVGDFCRPCGNRKKREMIAELRRSRATE